MPKNTTQKATNRPRKTATKWPPRGMTFESRRGREKPFLARWREIGRDGKKSLRASLSFEKKQDRDSFAKEWLKRRGELGSRAALGVSVSKLESWRKFDELTRGANPVEVALFWVRHHGGHTGESLTVSRVIEKYPETRSKPMSSTMKLHLSRLDAAFANRLFHEITPDDLRGWLGSLNLRRIDGQPPSPITIRQHCKSIRALWNAAVVQRWVSYNAAAAVPIPHSDGEGDEVNILSVDEARALFVANRDTLCVGRLALEAFGGLRYSSASRIRAMDILIDDEGIVMPGSKHKSGRRHFVSGWPPNLFAWIKHARPECWDVGARAYLDLKRSAFERAGLKPKKPAHGVALRPSEAAEVLTRKNSLRHSFASYHLALHRNQQLTAYLMTKTSLSSLNNDYRGRATNSEAQAYFSILP